MNNIKAPSILLLIIFCCIVNSAHSQEDYNSWTPISHNTGETPSCYTFKPKYSFNLNNYLRISVGGSTDIAIKLLTFTTSECIRYVYIRGGDTYDIVNIPEGYYYLKIAFGNDWRKTTALGTCFAKFIDSKQFLKGEDILDFHVQKTYNGEQVPCYELRLDVYTSNKNNAFDSEQISEEEFLK